MTKRRTKRRRSSVWREIRGQLKREEIIKRLVGKIIDSAFNGAVVGIFAVWAFFPKEFYTDLVERSAQAAQVQVFRAVAVNRLLAKSVINSTRKVSKLMIHT
jgi:hypothetical protein